MAESRKPGAFQLPPVGDPKRVQATHGVGELHPPWEAQPQSGRFNTSPWPHWQGFALPSVWPAKPFEQIALGTWDFILLLVILFP